MNARHIGISALSGRIVGGLTLSNIRRHPAEMATLGYITKRADLARVKGIGATFADMLEVIGNASKPCIAFKALAAGRHCHSPMAVAEALGVSRGTVYNKLRKFDLDLARFRTNGD